MFKGHWLVADVDGTLLPTPSKAGGKYYSFTLSEKVFGDPEGRAYHSCLPQLKRFIDHGGSLCVVSTAGKRLWQQVYTDLAPTLFPANAATASPPGRLLICGFTGAALFRSRAPQQLPAAWRATTPDSPCTTAPPPSVALEEWQDYRTVGHTTLSEASQAAAAEEGRAAIIRFFEHASAVSGHDPDRARDFFASCLSTKYHETYTEMLRGMLAETGTQPTRSTADGPTAAAAPVCFAGTHAMQMPALTTHGFFLKETHDALLDCQRVPAADGTVPQDAPVAQVVVMGIPMALYDIVFPRAGTETEKALHCCPGCRTRATRRCGESTNTSLPSSSPTSPKARQQEPSNAIAGAARLEAMGLTVKRQPNSVCIHQDGVDKGTCVRWLMQHVNELGDGCDFSLDRALSFGDVPASVDRPLGEFPPMQMISLSPLPRDGCSSEADRQVLVEKGMVHVGGEEEGTALFLRHLIEDCETAATAEPPRATWFTTERVQACAAKAAREVSRL